MTRTDQHPPRSAAPVDVPESDSCLWEVEVHLLGLTARFGRKVSEDATCS
jgi:hypothetical protein